MKQLLVFFGLAYLISWSIWLPLYGHIFGWTNLFKVPYQHAIGGLGPLLASFVTTWIFLRREGVTKLLKKCFQSKPHRYLVIASVSPFVLLFAAIVISRIVDKVPTNFSGLLNFNGFSQFHWLTFFLYNLAFFGFGEEAGWRGFALPRLQTKINALSASLVLTAFWALWHLPLFFYQPSFVNMNTAGVIGWIFSLLTGSVLLTWLYNSSKGSILICAIFHTTVDIAFSANIPNNNLGSYIGFLITAWGLLLVLIFKSKNLSAYARRTYRHLHVNRYTATKSG